MSPESAFYRIGITSVVLPNTLLFIGDYAFSNADSGDISVTYRGTENTFTEIIIPDSVTQIGAGAFQIGRLLGLGMSIQSQLVKVSIGSGVQTIGTEAFANNNLTEIALPDSLVTIGNGAFQSNQLQKVLLGRRIQTIGASAFSGNNLTEIELPSSLVTIEQWAFSDNLLQSVILPNSLKNIGEGAFSNNQIQSIALPNGIAVSSNIFIGNPLNTLVIPASLNIQIDLRFWLGPFWGGPRPTVFSELPLTQITMPANMSDLDLEHTGFETSFVNFYTNQRKVAGTYVRNGPIWTLSGN